MNSKRLVFSAFITLLFTFLIYSVSTAADNPSKTLEGVVITLDKEGKECVHAVSGCCSAGMEEQCEHTFGLKTSDGKIHPFAVKSNDDKVLDIEKFTGEKVNVSGYVCPISKEVKYSAITKRVSIDSKNGECCSKSQTTTVKN